MVILLLIHSYPLNHSLKTHSLAFVCGSSCSPSGVGNCWVNSGPSIGLKCNLVKSDPSEVHEHLTSAFEMASLPPHRQSSGLFGAYINKVKYAGPKGQQWGQAVNVGIVDNIFCDIRGVFCWLVSYLSQMLLLSLWTEVSRREVQTSTEHNVQKHSPRKLGGSPAMPAECGPCWRRREEASCSLGISHSACSCPGRSAVRKKLSEISWENRLISFKNCKNGFSPHYPT